MSQNHFLEIEKISAFYGAIQALDEVSINISKGEIVTLIGANGAGKSTLLMSIFGNPQVKNGRIIFDGTDITRTPMHVISSMGIAQSPEGRRIFSKMTVEENIIIGANAIGDEHIEADKENIFGLFPILKKRRKQTAGTLSGGEQQMLAIGRALMSRPKLLLLGEPSLGLAPLIVNQIFEIITEIASKGTTIFLVEQNAFHALKIANRGYVMVNGKIKMEGPAAELLANPEIKEAYLGGH